MGLRHIASAFQLPLEPSGENGRRLHKNKRLGMTPADRRERGPWRVKICDNSLAGDECSSVTRFHHQSCI